jgi:hypothetical protein
LGAALPADTTYFSIDERLDRWTLLEVYAEVGVGPVGLILDSEGIKAHTCMHALKPIKISLSATSSLCHIGGGWRPHCAGALRSPCRAETPLPRPLVAGAFVVV